MWSQLLLCALVGFAAASDFGWQDSKEYVYQVRGRTLTGLHDIENQFSGILMKAKLVIRPESDGTLMAKLVDSKYSHVHHQLEDGWKTQIPDSKLNYQNLELSDKPFQIVYKNGVVRDVIVDSEVHNWQANIIKSIVSQIQLDTQGEHVIKSHVNQLPEEDDNSAAFKTMEDTITGTYETMYDITPLPEYVLQSQPWLAPMPEIKRDGEFIEIVKSKNFSRAEERPSYYYGLGGMGDFEPATNQMGDFFARSSVSRAVVSGSLKHYTIQSSTTTNKIIVSPTLNSEQNGMVVSHLNLTLSEIKPASGSFERPQQGQNLGSLTYTFETPFSGNHGARQGAKHQENQGLYSSEERVHYRQRRSANQQSSESESVESSEEWAQEEAKLSQPPHSPLLPLYVGNKGKNVKTSQKVDAVQVAQKIAQQIGNEIQHPQNIHKEQTLAKYVILSSVARIMSQQEMQQVASKLYSKEQHGAQAEAWNAYRDAISECGTGPALLTIQEWIKNQKIQSEEAAEVIAAMAQSARQPTLEYMRAFHDLALKEHAVTKQAILNDTALLSYASLIRKVYVDRETAHNEFPVHSFGKFRTEKGQEHVAQQLIPELKQKLNEAIQHADSHKTLVYIRALGNIGHQRILAVFEPYLEGDKQVSQFQRLQMVIALDKLVQIHPKVARSVLYKIYQNAGESQEVRTAAVFQLMRTDPPASMLQRMAQYTNVDTDEQVNAAVKSAIETAAELEGEEYSEISQNARSAEPLLTQSTYGYQYSGDYLRDYVEQQMNLYYKQTVQTYGSQDSVFPKGLKYALRAGLGGAKRQLFNVQAMVSSIDELTNVLARQTEQYEHQQQQQRENHQQAQQHQWSSESIAKLLNIKNDEREQLEGSILFQIAGGATRFFTFNNQTLDLLPNVVRELESMLREGQDIQYTKFLNRYEVAISFPTEMALPFIYTLDAPTLLHFQGQVRATAEPKICNGETVRAPNSFTGQAELSVVLSTRVEAKLGFITPFDHQRYTSGYDKNIQAFIPIKAQVELDMNKQEFHASFKPAANAGDKIQAFQYNTWPYTAKHDILNLEPISLGHDCKIIKSEQPETEFQTVVGKQAGIALNVEYSSDAKFMDAYSVYEQFSRQDGVSAFLAPFYAESLHYTELSVEYDARQSNNKLQIHAGFQSHYENGKAQGSKPDIQQFSQLPREQQQRLEKFAMMASTGISSANVSAYDVVFEFDGHHKVEYLATAAWAKSPADSKARVLFYSKKSSANQQESKPFEVAMSAKTDIPNTNGLDFMYALKFDPTSTAEVELAFGESIQSGAKFHINAKLEKSESRKRYLQNHPRAQECREEMKEGNQQLPACANLTAEANLLDRVHVKVQFENLGPKSLNMTKKAYNAIRYLSFFNLDENTVNPQGSQQEHELEFEARFEPDFEAVNVTIRGQHIQSHIDNIRVNSFAKQFVAMHPVFPVTSRVRGELLDLDTYRPICVVDNSAANTFDNKTYPLDLGQSWTVMMQYLPTFARQEQHQQSYQQQQKQLQTEQHVVLVRDGKSDSQKEVKMTIRSPQTEGQVIEIDLKPAQGDCSGDSPCAMVTVNGKQIEYHQEQTKDIQHGYIKFYGLPNGDVKVQVHQSYYILYDGERVKFTIMHDKFRGAVRGLCGTFTGEEYNDFLTPRNCILRDPQEFAATYAVDAQGKTKQYQSRAEKSQCYDDEIIYANVISEYDAGRSHQKYSRAGNQQQQNQHNRQSGSASCTKHQTRYEIQESENEICFTIRPVPVCHGSCSPSKMTEKSVPVHCVQRSNVAELWRKQIENGASPDFSQKAATRSMKMRVPESCGKY